MMLVAVCVLLNLSAVCTANVLAAELGPWVTVPSAFVLIGIVLATRDVLHRAWGEAWPVRMAVLIAAGGFLSYLVTPGAGRIAIASGLSFLVAEAVDVSVFEYGRQKGWPWLRSANVSNLPAAAIDSVLFPLVAFGALLPWVTVGQFAAKVVGGFLWALLIGRVRAATRDQGSEDAADVRLPA